MLAVTERSTLETREPDAEARRPVPRLRRRAEPSRCWQMVYSRQMQATHCTEVPSYTGRWFSPRGDRFRVWACPDHLEGLTGLREFGRRR